MAQKERTASSEKDILIPHPFPSISPHPSHTQLFLSTREIQKLRDDWQHILEHHEDFKPLTVPSGVELKSISGPGKLGELAHKYASKSPYFLVSMTPDKLDEANRINEALKKKGVPVVNVLEDYAAKEEGNRLVLMGAEETTLYNLHNRPQGLSTEDTGGYMHALGTLHSLGVVHRHPHLANFFKRGGQVGVFDYSDAEYVNPDWRDAKVIYGAFREDYLLALRMLVNIAVRNKDVEAAIRDREVKPFLDELVKPLTAADEVKESLTNGLAVMLYEVVVPKMREDGFFTANKMRI